MKNRRGNFVTFALSLGLINGLTGCASTPTSVAPSSEVVTALPHPVSLDREGLVALMTLPNAPKAALGEFADRCDEDFSENNAITLVKQNSERMHWCFYAKLARLEIDLQSDSKWSTRQKQVQKVFRFLSPVAAAFSSLSHDERYAQWHKQYAAKVSEWVFFKKPASNRAPASVSETKTP